VRTDPKGRVGRRRGHRKAAGQKDRCDTQPGAHGWDTGLRG
jgi:hypothetical protein